MFIYRLLAGNESFYFSNLKKAHKHYQSYMPIQNGVQEYYSYSHVANKIKSYDAFVDVASLSIVKPITIIKITVL